MQQKQLLFFSLFTVLCLAAVAVVLSQSSPEEREQMRQQAAVANVPDKPEPEAEAETEQPTASEKEEEEKPYHYVEQMPKFPGGDNELFLYLKHRQVYPADAAAATIAGVVYVQLVITKAGDVERVKVIKGLYPSLDKEAVRLVEGMPRWQPGKQNGREVPVVMTLPVRFDQDKSRF